jgi:exodeoxyribonuclease V alpha subunit
VSNSPTVLSGSIERITFYSDETGYTVARFLAEPTAEYSGREPLTVVGNMLGVNVGEAIRLEGTWMTHPKHGRQFKVERYTPELPTSPEGLRRYLGSGLIKGIGPVTAERIVKRFGLETIEVIEQHAERLREVSGVGAKRVAMIAHSWATQKQIKEVMLFLQSYGISTGLAVKIYKAYGDAALGVVRKEPYRLARDIFGIGFLTADKIARALGMKVDDPARMEAGVRHVLSSFTNDGHVFTKRAELVQQSVITLDVPAKSAAGTGQELVAQAVERLASNNEIIIEEDDVYLTPFYRAEVGVANRVRQIVATRESRLAGVAHLTREQVAEWLRTRSRIALTAKQADAVCSALTAKITVLTGGPGTGKTTTVRGLIQLLKAEQHTFHLAAPTGRAAKRLSEATGEPAQTLHRLLEFTPSADAGARFMRDRDNPLDADLIIVDELSMIDLLLMNALLKAVAVSSHLLLVGDPDQLPSVGAGNVLKDLIASGLVPVIALDTIFRQSERSLIVHNAHRINHGELPEFNKSATDFFLFNEPEPEEAAARVVKLVTTSIPARFKLDAVNDIQVLSPMHRGVVGVAQFNLVLQAALNPPLAGKHEWRHGGRVFRTGDKVLQTRNNYDKQVFNGDMGRVREIDLEEQTVAIDFDGVLVSYDVSELDELTHAYAMSVHKSQGSEYRAVVIPLLTQHYMMLQRNLLYTAITRAKSLVVLVGTKRAIAIAVKNDKVAQRNSGLVKRLSGKGQVAKGK